MNNIQSKINSELRRPNAGKDALCNVVADVAQEIADNAGGGGTSIPVIKLVSVEEVSGKKGVKFDDASNKILDDLVVSQTMPDVSVQYLVNSNCIIGRDDSLSIFTATFSDSSEIETMLSLNTNDYYCQITTQYANADTILQFISLPFMNKYVLLMRYYSFPNFDYDPKQWFIFQSFDGN